MVSLQKSEASQRISERPCFFGFFFVFGPATVVEFRPSALERRFNCETNTKFEGYRLQANQIPTKMKLCLGFVWSQLKGYATNLTANGG